MQNLSLNDGFTALFDAEVDHLIAIISENNINKILANIVHITFHRSNQKLPFARAFAFDLFHVRLQLGHGRLHGFGALEHKGQLHLPRTKQIAHHLHAIQQEGVDDVQGCVALKSFIQSGLQADPLPIDDVLLEALFNRQIRQGWARRTGFLGADTLKQGGEFGEGIVGTNRGTSSDPFG